MTNRFVSAAVAVALLAGLSAFADNSELDGKATKAPAIIIKKLDPTAKTLTTYQLDSVDDSVKPEALAKLSKEEQKAKVEAFLKSVEKPENKIAEEKVESVVAKTELDKSSSTSACWYRWRGCYSGGYYGGGFYGGYYGYNNYYYAPAWNYSYGYGYGCGGNYYGYGYGYTYPSYTVYGYGW